MKEHRNHKKDLGMVRQALSLRNKELPPDMEGLYRQLCRRHEEMKRLNIAINDKCFLLEKASKHYVGRCRVAQLGAEIESLERRLDSVGRQAQKIIRQAQRLRDSRVAIMSRKPAELAVSA